MAILFLIRLDQIWLTCYLVQFPFDIITKSETFFNFLWPSQNIGKNFRKQLLTHIIIIIESLKAKYEIKCLLNLSNISFLQFNSEAFQMLI